MDVSSPSPTRLLVATADHELYRRVAGVLDGPSYLMYPAEDGTSALSILLGPNPPEIALLDAVLPEQCGVEVAAEVRRRSGKKQTWVILLSRVADPTTVSAATDAAVDDLLLCSANEPVSDVDLRFRIGIATRVHEHVRALEAQTPTVSRHPLRDSLTGLWNRESLLSLLFPETDRVQRMATPLGFLLLDLDHFSRINADYGYGTGDKILQGVAGRLRRYMRSYDLLGRSGDDEFLIALPGCNAHQTKHLASRIRTIMLLEPFEVGSDSIALSVSIGLTQSRGRSPLVVLREAEQALAMAKFEGRNCDREYVAPRYQKAEKPELSVQY